MNILKSPFYSQLRTDLIPSDLDALLIRRFIREETTQIQREKLRAKEVYNNLVAKHLQYLELIDNHQKLVYPLRRGLPDDVLQEIFLHCLPRDGYVVLHLNKAPLLLANGCTT
ncbi:hypothetical protein CPB83DRAFT_856023 [Crepidotus variabilis]|uniref:Uncharacterized protein n=1 Tax=Crepidotus variabilis TaxID=179855 RepID=A0A9P6JNY1_9AGAR|nr:hypothetical protein CPB83DRAFT_856023 [Crepidotus variabilis]